MLDSILHLPLLYKVLLALATVVAVLLLTGAVVWWIVLDINRYEQKLHAASDLEDPGP